MIQYIFINIKNGGLTHTISIDTDIDGNLPYDLAEAFAEVIRLTNTNPNMVVEELVAKYGLPESMQIVGDSENENNKRIWHDTSDNPDAGKSILVMFKSGDLTSWNVRDVADMNFNFKAFNVERWAYINDLLPKGGE